MDTAVVPDRDHRDTGESPTPSGTGKILPITSQPVHQLRVSTRRYPKSAQGIPASINNREIRIAKNQVRISDLTFENQVIATVSQCRGALLGSGER